MTSIFTCINCRVAFTDSAVQRQHYKTDWHRYNLKRKVAELPPVTAEEFQRRVVLQREEDEAKDKDTSAFCKVCHKTFNSSKSFDNHLKSKKHLSLSESSDSTRCHFEAEQANYNKFGQHISPTTSIQNLGLSDEDSIEEVDSDEWEEYVDDNNPILRNDCLFCSHHSATLTKNVNHMTISHSFFIPDIQYLIDLKGLLCYLGEKISSGHMCLWCNDSGRTFMSMEAAQQHMIDKGHCKMIHEGEALLEYSNFYDYRKSYPDCDENQTDNEDLDDEVNIPVIDDEDYQLVLPSGAIIGHRSLMRYYRQNFDPNKVVVPVQKKINRVISQYKALGWTEGDKQAIFKKSRDLKFMHRVWSKNNMKLGVKANKLSIKRPQVNF